MVNSAMTMRSPVSAQQLSSSGGATPGSPSRGSQKATSSASAESAVPVQKTLWMESATGNAEAARARQRAVESYLAYRREGGYGTTPSARLCEAAAGAIAAADTSELEQFLSQPLDEDTQPWVRAVFPKVLAVLRGERDPALAADPALDYDDAAELMLLLEALGVS